MFLWAIFDPTVLKGLRNYRQRPYLTDSVITTDVGKNYISNSLHTLHPADNMHEYLERY